MPKYLIEVHHENDEVSCKYAIAIFLNSGSHFLTHADWGCHDGVHKMWLILDIESKEEALQIVPPAFRKDTRIIQLNRFSVNDIDKRFLHHKV